MDKPGTSFKSSYFATGSGLGSMARASRLDYDLQPQLNSRTQLNFDYSGLGASSSRRTQVSGTEGLRPSQRHESLSSKFQSGNSSRFDTSLGYNSGRSTLLGSTGAGPSTAAFSYYVPPPPPKTEEKPVIAQRPKRRRKTKRPSKNLVRNDYSGTETEEPLPVTVDLPTRVAPPSNLDSDSRTTRVEFVDNKTTTVANDATETRVEFVMDHLPNARPDQDAAPSQPDTPLPIGGFGDDMANHSTNEEQADESENADDSGDAGILASPSHEDHVKIEGNTEEVGIPEKKDVLDKPPIVSRTPIITVEEMLQPISDGGEEESDFEALEKQIMEEENEGKKDVGRSILHESDTASLPDEPSLSKRQENVSEKIDGQDKGSSYSELNDEEMKELLDQISSTSESIGEGDIENIVISDD